MNVLLALLIGSCSYDQGPSGIIIVEAFMGPGFAPTKEVKNGFTWDLSAKISETVFTDIASLEYDEEDILSYYESHKELVEPLTHLKIHNNDYNCEARPSQYSTFIVSFIPGCSLTEDSSTAVLTFTEEQADDKVIWKGEINFNIQHLPTELKLGEQTGYQVIAIEMQENEPK